MSSIPTAQTAAPVDRAAVNRANSLHSTGPRTGEGKQRSSLNALRHGLTAEATVLPSEDPAAYAAFLQEFMDEYRPATATETQLVRELAGTAWRQNRIPRLETEALARAANPPTEQAAIDFDIVDAHRAISILGLHGQRLSRVFLKTLQQLRSMQMERREREQKELKEAAGVLEHAKHKGLPFDPAELGFVFSKDEIERYAQRLIRINQSRQVAWFRFDTRPVPGLELRSAAL